MFFLTTPKISAQEGADCRKIFDQDMKKCSIDFNACRDACSEQTKKPDGTIYFNSGEIYTKCMKESDCHGKSSACSNQALEDYRACVRTGKQPADSEAKKEVASGKGFVEINVLESWAEFISDPASIVKETEVLIEKSNIPEGPRITPPHILHKIAEEVSFWLDQQKQAKDLWVKPKGQNEYQPFNPFQTVEPGSYVKVAEPTDFWVRGVGKVQLRPGPSGNALVAIEEINGVISPLLLLGEMEVAYSKPVVESTQKLVDWEQIKFVVRTPNSSVTVSRTHYLVKYDEKENKTTVTVYEGQVEVKPAGGKAISITPNGDKPGVVVVSQKLSLVKLAAVGAVLAVVVGGIIWFLKKKTLVKSSKKR